MPTQHPWKQAFTITTPVMLGYIPLGIAFGLLAVQLGFSMWVPVAMSVFVYSGASQFLLISLLASGASLVTITTAGLLINSRHMFYGLSLQHLIKPKHWRQAYTMFALTDETYALLNNPAQPLTPDLASRIAALNQGWWVLGSFLGAMAGQFLTLDAGGLAFSLTALFIVLTLEQAKHRSSYRPFAFAVMAALSALLLLPEAHFLLATIAGGCFLLWIDFNYSSKGLRQ